jgi:hypothetical protein
MGVDWQVCQMLFLALISGAPVLAQSRDEDSIKSVSDDGAIIEMRPGTVFRVDDPVDQIITRLWLPADNVLICSEAEIINKDENGEQAFAAGLR